MVIQGLFLFCLLIGSEGGFWSIRRKKFLRTAFLFWFFNIQNVFLYIRKHIYIHICLKIDFSFREQAKYKNLPWVSELLAYKMDIPPSASFTRLHRSEWTSRLEFLTSPVWSIDFSLDVLIPDFLGGSQTVQVKLTWGQCLKMQNYSHCLMPVIKHCFQKINLLITLCLPTGGSQ